MAFHSYAHLIQKLFNAYWCGPPCRVTGTSPWTCVDHSVSRPPRQTQRPLQPRFHSGYAAHCGLASPGTVTRRFIMQKARRHHKKTWLRPLVGAWFQGLFHSPARGAFHRSLTVLFAIGLTGVFSLAGWTRRIRAGFHVSRATQEHACTTQQGPYGAFILSGSAFQRIPVLPEQCAAAVLQPPHGVATARVWALPRSLATTGGIIVLFSFPPGTKMFQFPGLASTATNRG